MPFEPANIIDVALDLWPDYVEECEPWPLGFDLASYAPYKPETARYLDELRAEEDRRRSLLAASL